MSSLPFTKTFTNAHGYLIHFPGNLFNFLILFGKRFPISVYLMHISVKYYFILKNWPYMTKGTTQGLTILAHHNVTTNANIYGKLKNEVLFLYIIKRIEKLSVNSAFFWEFFLQINT